jgi:argininosuccinate lyase
MKLWGGRFEGQTDKAADSFHSSLPFDRRLWRQDIRGSIAHAEMLGRQGVIPAADADAIVAGLEGIYGDIESGKIKIGEADSEDIHSFVEALLTARIGEAGKRLHTGRSRNDQVALDFRMYVRDSCDEAFGLMKTLVSTLLDIAIKNDEVIMPGFTHLQKAQPITLGFHMMAYVEMLLRDASRFLECRGRAAVMPLGSGALAGTTYPLDRMYVAEKLGFPTVTHNALDAVADRDFTLDFLYACSVCMMHLSRLCEEIVLWASDEYRFITLSDAYSTGSSIMPQKKNPDVAELVRGKTGRVYGSLIALLTAMKGLPLAYDKDMQEDKEALFDARDTLFACLSILAPMLASSIFDVERMEKSASSGFSNATDAADYLVGKGIAFREAHEIIGRMVLHCIRESKGLEQLTEKELRAFSPLIDAGFYEAVSLKACVRRRNIAGGTAPERVREHIEKARQLIKNW